MLELPERTEARGLTRVLVRWYRDSARDLPWRRTRDPYAIWVSEVMLQQTQVATVIPYFRRWMRRFPSVEALGSADEGEVLHAWQGLGYYSRARALRRGARVVLERHRGRIPESVVELRSLPGVGPYTAGAIASIAFGVRAPVVDGNVSRVLARLFALDGDLARAPLKNHVWAVSEALVPAREPGELNQALMELGATVCVPKKPLCSACPVRRACRAYAEGRQAELPAPKPRPAPTEVSMAAAVLERRGRVLVAQLAEDAPRWAGMWIFPMVTLAAGESPARGAERALLESAALPSRASERLTTVRHAVTRFRITLEAVRCSPEGGRARAVGCRAVAWKAPRELEALALPAAHQKVARALLG